MDDTNFCPELWRKQIFNRYKGGTREGTKRGPSVEDERNERNERNERSERSERNERIERIERGERIERNEGVGRNEGVEKLATDNLLIYEVRDLGFISSLLYP